MDYIRVQSTPYFSWDFDFKSDFGPVKLPGLSRNMPQGSSTIKCVQTMPHKARDSDSKYALLLLLCRHIGLLFSRWLDSNLLRHRTWNYPGSSVHKLPDSLRIFCFVLFCCFFHSGERISKYADSLANSPDACLRDGSRVRKKKLRIQKYLDKCGRDLRPGSNAVLHMSRTQFNQLGSCEVRRLTLLSSTDFSWSDWGVLHAWPAVNNAWRPILVQTLIFTSMSRTKCIIKGRKAPICFYLENPLTIKTAFAFVSCGSTALSATFDSNRRS